MSFHSRVERMDLFQNHLSQTLFYKEKKNERGSSMFKEETIT
jgi:hypothetical protein